MPGHPDYDAGVIWQAPASYSLVNANIPPAGTVLFSGPVTGWPSVLLRGFAFTGGFEIEVAFFMDSALTVQVETETFDALSNQGFYFLYEIQAPYMRVKVVNATGPPAPTGQLVVLLTRAPALTIRPLVPPQTISLNGFTVPAMTTSRFTFMWMVLGNMELAFPAVSPAGAIQFSTEVLNWDGSVNIQLVPFNVVPAGGASNGLLPARPFRLSLQNTTANPATITALAISQQQGW